MVRTEQYINQYPIPIIDCIKSPQNSPTVLIEFKGRFSVFLNTSLQLTDAEIKTALCHEQGHIETGCTHKLMSDTDLISQHEYKANAYMYETLMPLSDIYRCIENGQKEVYEIADALEMPAKVVADGLEYYMRHDDDFRQYVWRLRDEETR